MPSESASSAGVAGSGGRTRAKDTRDQGVFQTSNGRSAGSEPLTDNELRRKLADHVGALRFVNGTISVCVQALQQQDADMDAEIALVLQRTAGDKLDATIDRIEALVLGLEYDEGA